MSLWGFVFDVAPRDFHYENENSFNQWMARSSKWSKETYSSYSNEIKTNIKHFLKPSKIDFLKIEITSSWYFDLKLLQVDISI